MRLIYSVFLLLLTPLLWVYLLLRSRKDAAYRQRIAERFGFGRILPQQQGGILVHTVSVGEFNAARPVLNGLLQAQQASLTVSCTTPTASASISAFLPTGSYHCYLPFDYPFLMKRWLRRLSPKLVVILETELWPNMLHCCNELGIPVQVINARLSARSARGYRRFHWLTGKALSHISLIQTQDLASARRFRALGAPVVEVAGNIKYELQLPDRAAQLAAVISPVISGRYVVVAGSTHDGEDAILLAAVAQLRQLYPSLLLILVPRHPERFNAVAELVQQQGLTLARRSLEQLPDNTTAVWLGDSMGELLSFYQLADVVFIGGSLIPRGGHNPLEAMVFGKPLLSGPHVFNFATVFRLLQRRNAVRYAADSAQLVDAVSALLADPVAAQAMGQRGAELYQQQQGAVAKVLKAANDLLLWHDYRSQQTGNTLLWADNRVFDELTPSLLDAAYWQQQHAITGQSSGRNTVWFIQAGGRQWVLRHYYRGGLVGKVNRDAFWPVAVAKSRAMAEFMLLRRMRQWHLPVPAAGIAARHKRLFGYSADILIERIADSQDLYHYLQQAPLADSDWYQLGAVIARFHRYQIYHSDLNCHNILRDTAGNFYLIDFDKCDIRGGQSWKAATLARLLRSFKKEQNKEVVFHFSEHHFSLLLQGYRQYQPVALMNTESSGLPAGSNGASHQQ